MEDNIRPSFSAARKWLFSLHFLLTLAGLLAVLGMANYLSARHHLRFDWSSSASTQLSPLTGRVLSNLTNDVKITIYYDKDEPLYHSVWGLLKEYKFRSSRLSIETVDYERDPGAAELVKRRYDFGGAAEKNVVIFECNGRVRFVEQKQLSDLDLSALMGGESREVKRTHFRGEMEFTSAILSVSNPRPLKAYFLQGHGEHQPDSDDKPGYSEFAGVLRENNVQLEPLRLAIDAEIPADCNLLIIAGPTEALFAKELEKLDRYLRQGGRAFVLFNYQVLPKETGLERILAKWGVAVGKDVVMDRKNTITGSDVVISRYGVHPITKPFYQSMLQLLLPRSVSKAQTRGADAPQVEPLAVSGDEARVVTEIRAGQAPKSTPTDYVGPVSLVVAVEQGSIPGVSAERGSTRIVVAGDSFFLANELIQGVANRDFASHILNWLLARNELLGTLGPKPIKEYKLNMTTGQLQSLRWILLAGLPGAVLLVGMLVSFRRRR
jgi:ABC-type uncharacterized transport system involved in gliding motility auxiliary subunit